MSPVADILKKIETYRRREIAEAKVRVPRATLSARSGQNPAAPIYPGDRAVAGRRAVSAHRRDQARKPSKDLIREDFERTPSPKPISGRHDMLSGDRVPVFSGIAGASDQGAQNRALPSCARIPVRPCQVAEARAGGSTASSSSWPPSTTNARKSSTRLAHDFGLDVLDRDA